MKHINWVGPIDVIPAGVDEEGLDRKELILHDPDSGEIIHYPMTQALADQIGRKLRGTNRYLEDEIQRAQARAKLTVPGHNGGGVPLSSELSEELQRRSEH